MRCQKGKCCFNKPMLYSNSKLSLLWAAAFCYTSPCPGHTHTFNRLVCMLMHDMLFLHPLKVSVTLSLPPHRYFFISAPPVLMTGSHFAPFLHLTKYLSESITVTSLFSHKIYQTVKVLVHFELKLLC